MKKNYHHVILACLLMIMSTAVFGQALTGTKTIPGNYSSIAAAIADLNTNGVGAGGVIFNIITGYTETLSAPLAVTATGTAANPIIFRKDLLGTGANPLVIAYSGTRLASSTTTVDGIWSFSGSDYITIDGIDLLDPTTNTTATTTMEFGYGFFKTSATDGANNNTVENCVITLNRINTTTSTGPRWAGSIGIEVSACTLAAVGTTITQTSVAGASSNNKFYSNTIQNCNGGIALSGAAVAAPYTLADLNNDIGGTSALTGNTIINFGGGTSATNACMAAWANNQWNFNISYNTVNNNNGTGVNHPATNRGIFAAASSAGAGANINGNNLTIQGGSSLSAIDYGIDCEMAKTGANGNTININNNTITVSKTVASTAAFTGIWISSAATTVNVNNNVFPSFTYAGTGVSECILSDLAGIGTLNIMNNSMAGVALSGAKGNHYNIAVTAGVNSALNITGDTINGVTLTGATTKVYRGIYVGAALAPSAISINNNSFQNFTWSGGDPTGEFDLIYAIGTASSYTINNNALIGSISCPSKGVLYLIYNSQATPRVNISNNAMTGTGVTKTRPSSGFYGYYNVVNVAGGTTGTAAITGNIWNNMIDSGGITTMYGVYFISGNTVKLFKNNTITNISSVRPGDVAGLYYSGGEAGSEISGNIISNISGTSTVSGILLLPSGSNALSIVNNQINGITTSGAALATGIMHPSGLLTTINNNKIYNVKGDNVGASASGITISGGTTITVHHNLIDSITTPLANAANPLAGISIISATNVNLYYNTILLAGTSSGALFGSSGVYAGTGTNLRMNNNIIINNTIPTGAAGFAVAYRRSSVTLTSYSDLSNNNLFYAGAPATANYYLYYDGTNKDSIFDQFQTRVAPRDAASATENVVFMNTVGSLANFLQPDSTVPTKVESGAGAIAGFTKDFDGNQRYGSAGYTGTGTAPDMGAYEKNLTGIPMMYSFSNADQVMEGAFTHLANQKVLRMSVYTENAFAPVVVTQFKLNTAGTTNIADISNAKVFYTGGSSTFNTSSQFGNVEAVPNGTFYITGSQALILGVNYFWLTYDVSATANVANVIDGRFDSVVVGGINRAPLNPAPSGGTPISVSLAGNYTIGIAPYFTLAAAIADLNLQGLSSSVVINVPAGYTELAPAGGYVLGSTRLNGNLTAGRTLTITKYGAGVNPLLYAYTGTTITSDAMFVMMGCDYVTVNGIDLIDTNTVSATTQMEVGYTLVKLNKIAPFDGCQHDTIMNATVTLSRNNVNATGIYVNNVILNDATQLNITTTADANSYNTIINDTIQNTSSAIVFYGFNAPSNMSLRDLNNVVNNNVIVDFNGGGGGGFGYGISMTNQTNNTISNNLIDNYNNGVNGAVAGSGPLFGIFNAAAYTDVDNVSNVIIDNNFIKLTQGASSGLSRNIYVNCSRGNVTITNNILKVATSGAFAASGSYTGIFFTPGGKNLPSTTQLIKNNHMDSVTINNTSGTMTAFYTSGACSNSDYSGNTFTYFSRTGGIFGPLYGWNSDHHGFDDAMVVNMYNNIVDSINNGTSTGYVYGYSAGSSYNFNFYNNTINRVVAKNANDIIAAFTISSPGAIDSFYNNTITNITGGTFSLNGIYLSSAKSQLGYFYNNTITNLTGGPGGTVCGINDKEQFGGTVALHIFKNKIASLSCDPVGGGTITGISISGDIAGPPTNLPINIYNNLIGNLGSAGTTINPGVIGIRFESPNGYNYVANTYYNTINLTDSLGANGSSAGVYIGSSITVKLTSNIIINNTTVSGTGYASAIQFNGAPATTSYDITSNNNLLYAGTPGTYHVIYNDGINRDQAIDGYKTRIWPRDVASITENTTFINGTVPTLPNYLQPDSTIATGIESGAVSVAGMVNDFNDKVRQGNTGYTGTGAAPDIGAFEGNYAAADYVAPAISFTQPGNTSSTADRVITATIKDYTGVPVLSFSPVLYYKKFMAGSYAAAAGVRTSGNAKNGIWSFTIPQDSMGGLALGDSVYYYIVAQDSSVGNNLGSFPSGVIGTDVNNITTPPVAFTYKIVPGLTGTLTVGATGTYTSLTNTGGAFDAINNSALSGNVTLQITSNLLESGSIALNKWSETGAGNYRLRIVPDAAVERVIIDTATSTINNAGIIIFNGATRVTVDGRFGGSGRYLRFRNRVASGVVFMFRNDAVRDTVMYTNMECINNTTGTVLFGGSTVAGGSGNDSNVVIYNNIGDTLGAIVPAGAYNAGISSLGTAGLENDANTIAFNNIYNWNLNAINLNTVGTGDNWTIYGNSIYQTGSRPNTYSIIYIQGGGGHIIRKNSIGGAAPDRSGTAMNANSIRCIYQNGSSFIPNSIDSNSIGNINVTGIMSSIAVAAGSANISNNIIGALQSPWDSIVAGTGNNIGIDTRTDKDITITNNTIGNLIHTGGGNGALNGIYAGSYGNVNVVSNNTIRNLVGNASGTTLLNYHAGIVIQNEQYGRGPVLLDNNTIYNITNTSIGAVSGITIVDASSNCTITKSKIYNLSSQGMVSGINRGPATNYGSLTLTNNQIVVSATNATGQVNGIMAQQQYDGTKNSYYNNTVFVNGIAGSTATGNSYAFYRSGISNDVLDIRNNIFYNKRTGGTGSNYAIGYANGILPSTVNYNLMVVADTANLIEMPSAIPTGVAAFNDLYAGSPNTNWMALTSAVPAQTLFADTAAGNLGIVTTHANSWYANGKGIAIAEVATDYNGAARSTTIAGGATDIGAVEFTTATVPPSATASAAPALNTTTNYTFAGRKVASITWGGSGTVPASLSVQYYTGTDAPSLLPAKTHYNSYYAVTPTGGSGYTYTISLAYDSSMLGSVSSTSTSKVARYQSPNWALLSGSVADGTTGILSSGVSAAAITLPANFTGTDNVNNPLPVTLLELSARKMKNDVIVNWITASESNSDVFEVERAFDGNNFDRIGTVSAKGNSSKTVSYQYSDDNIIATTRSNMIYYRLKMIDKDGSVEYSKVMAVNTTKDVTKTDMVVYPNPFTETLTVSMVAKNAGKAHYIIYDITGKSIFSYMQDVTEGENQISISAESLKAGFYFLSVNADGETHTVKLIKQ